MKNIDPYKNSTVVQKLKARVRNNQPLRIACLDLDSTMTGKTLTVNKTREKLEELGFVTVFITSRTEEIVMSKSAYQKSVAAKTFLRPIPQLVKKNGKYIYIPPEDVIPQGLLNPDIIAGSTGTSILLLQKNGSFIVDRSYEQKFSETSVLWRKKTLVAFNEVFQSTKIGILEPIDIQENYKNGVVDVYPPDFRVQVNFSSLQKKSIFIKKFLFILQNKKLQNIHITDDSKPKENRYTVYLTPENGSKIHAAEHIVARLCDNLHISRNKLTLLFCGDSFPDLEMGLQGGLGVNATLLLVGKSRLTNAMVNSAVHHFAGEKIRKLKKKMNEKKKNGHYTYSQIERPQRNIIIGDEAFVNTRAVETVYMYLQTLTLNESDDFPEQR